MAVRIRLQRHGKKGNPIYFIVAADARAKRDGKYIERLGTYNPNTNPATIDLDVDGAVKWLQNGAETTNTARAILSYKGALYKNHLLGGVAKGAFGEEEVDKKFAKWLEDKEAKIQAKASGLEQSKEEAKKAQIAAEKEAREKAALEEEKALAAAEGEAATVEEVAEVDEAKAQEEAPVEEAVAESTEQAPAEEAKEDAGEEAEEA